MECGSCNNIGTPEDSEHRATFAQNPEASCVWSPAHHSIGLASVFSLSLAAGFGTTFARQASIKPERLKSVGATEMKLLLILTPWKKSADKAEKRRKKRLHICCLLLCSCILTSHNAFDNLVYHNESELLMNYVSLLVLWQNTWEEVGGFVFMFRDVSS